MQTSPWRLASLGEIYDADEGSVVYYEPRSGDTHLLNDFAAFLIQELAASALTTAQLVERATPHTEAPEAEQLSDAIESVLVELVSLDILTRD